MLPLIFIAIPLIEIALFVTIGGAIGLGWTLAIVVGTAILGVSMLRRQGNQAILNLRSSFNEVRDPTEPLAHGAMIVFAGALLLTPGFFTDAIGFSLLIPGVRNALYEQLRARIKVQHFDVHGVQTQHGTKSRRPQDRVVEGEYEDVTPEQNRPSGPSGWTK